MGRLGAVVKSYLATVPGTGATAQWIAVEELSGDERKAQVFGPANEDFAPAETTKTLDIQLGSGRGFLVSAAYYNPHITPIALPGERRLYSTDKSGGTLKAQIHLKQDGEITVDGPAASVTITPAGVITVNADGNVTINTDGNAKIAAGGDVDIDAVGDATVDATAVKLNGDTYTLVMWEDLNTQLQALNTWVMAHTHGTSPAPNNPIVLDITGAQAATLKTDG